jgi:Tfp pilus assembly protein PilO
MKLKPTKAGVVMTVVAVLVIGVPGKMAFGMRDSARNEAATVQADTAQQLITLAQARKLNAKLPELTKRLATIRDAMPADPALQDTIDSLSKLASDSGCLWQSANVAVPNALQREAAKADAAASRPSAAAATDQAAADASSGAAATDATKVDPNAAAADGSSTDAASSDGTGDGTGISINPVDPYELSIEVTCAPDSIGTYLGKIRDLTRIVTIEKLSLSVKEADASDATTGGGPVMLASMTLRAFSWLGGKDTTAADTSTGAADTSTSATDNGSTTP